MIILRVLLSRALWALLRIQKIEIIDNFYV